MLTSSNRWNKWKTLNKDKLPYIERAKEITRAFENEIITPEKATNLYNNFDIGAHNAWKASLHPIHLAYIQNQNIHLNAANVRDHNSPWPTLRAGPFRVG